MNEFKGLTLKCGSCGQQYALFFREINFSGLIMHDCDDCVKAEKSRENLE